jgi:hypothetical protein
MIDKTILTNFSLEQVLILPCVRTEGEMAEMAGNPLIRENSGCYNFWLSHATKHASASDQSALEPRVIKMLWLNRLWNRC